jgi:hypothetical protein
VGLVGTPIFVIHKILTGSFGACQLVSPPGRAADRRRAPTGSDGAVTRSGTASYETVASVATATLRGTPPRAVISRRSAKARHVSEASVPWSRSRNAGSAEQRTDGRGVRSSSFGSKVGVGIIDYAIGFGRAGGFSAPKRSPDAGSALTHTVLRLCWAMRLRPFAGSASAPCFATKSPSSAAIPGRRAARSPSGNWQPGRHPLRR